MSALSKTRRHAFAKAWFVIVGKRRHIMLQTAKEMLDCSLKLVAESLNDEAWGHAVYAEWRDNMVRR